MAVTFTAWGHKNILALHKTTVEITKETELSLNGDCVIGVNSDFDFDEVADYIKGKDLITITFKAGDFSETIKCIPNKAFTSSREIVIRKSDFLSGRTLGTMADKSSFDLSRDFAELLKNPSLKIKVTIE